MIKGQYMTQHTDHDPKAEKTRLDPRNLMREAYAIDGIDIWQCRSIFLDWALGWPVDTDMRPMVSGVLAIYGTDHPDHPMTQVLRAALDPAPTPRRRGGRSARSTDPGAS